MFEGGEPSRGKLGKVAYRKALIEHYREQLGLDQIRSTTGSIDDTVVNLADAYLAKHYPTKKQFQAQRLAYWKEQGRGDIAHILAKDEADRDPRFRTGEMRKQIREEEAEKIETIQAVEDGSLLSPPEEPPLWLRRVKAADYVKATQVRLYAEGRGAFSVRVIVNGKMSKLMTLPTREDAETVVDVTLAILEIVFNKAPIKGRKHVDKAREAASFNLHVCFQRPRGRRNSEAVLVTSQQIVDRLAAIIGVAAPKLPTRLEREIATAKAQDLALPSGNALITLLSLKLCELLALEVALKTPKAEPKRTRLSWKREAMAAEYFAQYEYIKLTGEDECLDELANIVNQWRSSRMDKYMLVDRLDDHTQVQIDVVATKYMQKMIAWRVRNRDQAIEIYEASAIEDRLDAELQERAVKQTLEDMREAALSA